MSPSQPQRGGTIHNDSEVERIFRREYCNEPAPIPTTQIRGDNGRATFSSSLAVEVDFSPAMIEVAVREWCLDIRRTERGVATFDSRLHIGYINPIINFEAVRVRNCQFVLDETSQWTNGRGFEGEGRLVRYRPGFEGLEIEVHRVSICLPAPPHVPSLAEDFGKAPVEKPNKRAEALLLSVLDKEQQNQYRAEKLFYFTEQEKETRWRFRFKYHFPVAYKYLDQPNSDFRGLCVDLDQETPTEDILLMCYLEVKGGRGDKLIHAATDTVRNGRFARSYSGRRPSAVIVDDVETDSETIERLSREINGATNRETATSAIDHARLSRDNAWDARAADLARLTGERLTRSTVVHCRAIENLQRLRRVFQQVTIEGVQEVSCSPPMYDWIRRNVSQAGYMPMGESTGHVSSILGVNFIVTRLQREPIKIVRRE